MSTTLLKQQKLNSLRRKDKMWIYKNPQGLLILENELDERRKKRSARHRSTLPETYRQERQTLENYEKAVLTAPVMRVESPKEILVPIVKKTEINSKPANIFIEKPLRKPTPAKPSVTTRESNKKPSLIEEKSKLFKSSNNNSSISPREVLGSTSTTTSKLEKTAAAPPRDKSNQDGSFLQGARQKLSSVQRNASKVSEPGNLVPPPKRKGLVSSFVSAFETSSSDLSPSNKKMNLLRTNIYKPKALTDVKPTASQSYNHVFPSRLASRSPQPSMKPTGHSVMPSPSTTVSSPALSTVSASSYFPSVAAKSEIASSSCTRNETVSPSNEINIYLPQLSPEISFHHKGADTLDDIPADEEEASKTGDSANEILDKEVVSILVRPVIKKQVSFSEQLTYIPEQSDDDTSSCASESPKSPLSHFSKTLNHELTDTKTRLIAERKVNASVSRDKFVPAVANKADPRSSLASVNTPKKLSNKLLNMFQQPFSNPSVKQQQVKIPEPPQQQQTRKLVHLTASRPRKPSSFKQPTYSAMAAHPDGELK